VEQVVVRHKGVPVSGDRDCILQYFAKKPRSGVVIKTYNFSTVLDLNLVIENKFFQEVSNHLEQGSNVLDTGVPKVSGSSM
jgi:hypothetical protein